MAGDDRSGGNRLIGANPAISGLDGHLLPLAGCGGERATQRHRLMTSTKAAAVRLEGGEQTMVGVERRPVCHGQSKEDEEDYDGKKGAWAKLFKRINNQLSL